MEPIRLADLPERDVFPGFHGRVVHSGAMTFAWWRIDAGAALPEHHHEHEQVVNVLAGTFELVVEGQPMRLAAGEVAVIPPGAAHSGQAVTDCRVLDVFHPVREDYR